MAQKITPPQFDLHRAPLQRNPKAGDVVRSTSSNRDFAVTHVHHYAGRIQFISVEHLGNFLVNVLYPGEYMVLSAVDAKAAREFYEAKRNEATAYAQALAETAEIPEED